MKMIKPSPNEHQFPRNAVKSVECRKRDLVVRITNWLSDKDEPAFDVEVYVGGVYDWNKSKSFILYGGLTRKQAKTAAVKFAGEQIAKLL
jgi:hypothetical protein